MQLGNANIRLQKDEMYYAVTWAIDEIKQRHVVVVGGVSGNIRVIDPRGKKTRTVSALQPTA